MSIPFRLLFLTVACAALPACGGDESDGGGSSSSSSGNGYYGSDSPQAGDASYECERFLTTYCARVNECSLNVNESECLTAQRTEINCGNAADVTDSYERCLDEIQSSSCDGAFGNAVALPASCDGAILMAY